MKCPKCEYLGFEDVDRCRNCGYDFSLTSPSSLPELPLRDGREDAPGVLGDLELLDRAAAEHLEPSRTVTDGSSRRSREMGPIGDDLPLFGDHERLGLADAALSEEDDDGPLIHKTSPPRPPLSVRRATPETPRLRVPASKTPMLDLGAFETEPAAAPTGRPSWSDTDVTAQPAGAGARVAAAAVDIIILLAIDVVVVYLTMQVCGVRLEELSIIPKAPLFAFLLAQNLGYFIGFNVGGQTIGKMATGIRVVSARNDAAPDFGHSVLRTLVWFVLAIPAGLGFLTTLFGHERRGLHDRCAGTKVIRASA